eukprot:1158757-Pelagomonas_calceolata.AAC.8
MGASASRVKRHCSLHMACRFKEAFKSRAATIGQGNGSIAQYVVSFVQAGPCRLEKPCVSDDPNATLFLLLCGLMAQLAPSKRLMH